MTVTMKTTRPSKVSKQAHVAAMKIKASILNTSSFFKSTLKTNNQALAVALQAQRERGRLLEIEVMTLLKHVEELTFSLAALKSKHRKMHQMVKAFQLNSEQFFLSTADLLSDDDSSEPSEDLGNSCKDVNEEILNSPGRTASIRPQAECSRNQANPTTDTNTSQRVPLEASNDCQTDMEKGDSNLRDQVDRLSASLSVSEVKSSSAPSGKTQPQRYVHQDTVLLNSTMEMTLCHPVDIETVESKAKKTGYHAKPKIKNKKREESILSAEQQTSVNLRSDEVPVSSSTQADQNSPKDIRAPEGPDCLSIKVKDRKGFQSRIPKPASIKKKDQFNSQQLTQLSGTSLDLEDWFSDCKTKHSKITTAEKGSREEVDSLFPSRNSNTSVKRLSSVTRKTLVSLSSDGSDNSLASVFPHGEKHRKDPQLPEEPVVLVDDAQIEPGSNRSDPDTLIRSRKPRCRSTFVVSVLRESTASNKASLEQEPSPLLAFSSKSQEIQDSQTETQSSWKRPRVETQEVSTGCLEDQRGSDYFALPMLEEDITAASLVKKQKKSRKDRVAQSSKKKRRQPEDGEKENEPQKRNMKTKDIHLKSDSRTGKEVCTTPGSHEGPNLHYSRLDTDKHSKFFLIPDFPSDSQQPQNMSKTPDSCTTTSALGEATEIPLRKTFVVSRRKTRNTGRSSTRRPESATESFGSVRNIEAEMVDPNLEEALIDEPNVALSVVHTAKTPSSVTSNSSASHWLEKTTSDSRRATLTMEEDTETGQRKTLYVSRCKDRNTRQGFSSRPPSSTKSFDSEREVRDELVYCDDALMGESNADLSFITTENTASSVTPNSAASDWLEETTSASRRATLTIEEDTETGQRKTFYVSRCKPRNIRRGFSSRPPSSIDSSGSVREVRDELVHRDDALIDDSNAELSVITTENVPPSVSPSRAVSDWLEETPTDSTRTPCSMEEATETQQRKTFFVSRRKTRKTHRSVPSRQASSTESFGSVMEVGDEIVDQNLDEALIDTDLSVVHNRETCSSVNPKGATSVRQMETEEPDGTSEAEPGRSATPLTPTQSPDTMKRSCRRQRTIVTYKDPPLNRKLRRGDKFTDGTFLKSPAGKDGKKRGKKRKTAVESKHETTKSKAENPAE